MKRYLAALAVVCLLFSFPIAGSALGPGNSESKEVLAIYVPDSTPSVRTVLPKDGKYITKTETGTQVQVEAAEDSSLLIVREIDENQADAFSWLSDQMPKKTRNYYALQIQYLKNAERAPLPAGRLVEVTPPNGQKLVLGIRADGSAVEITSEIQNGILRFRTVREVEYYVLYETIPQPPVTPTGDRISGTYTVLALSLIGLAATLCLFSKKKNRVVR